jgi:O-antigen/teichoic acid export membrane protein
MDPVEQPVARTRGGNFMRHNAIYWSASLGVSFINYLYYPILGRLMPPTAFGETQTIISIYTQAAIFFQVLSLVSIGIIAKYSNEKQRNKINDELSRVTLLLSTIMLLLTVAFSPLLKNFFHFGGLAPFLALAVALLLAVPLSFANAYLQGHTQFWKLSLANFLGAVGKIIFAVIFVLLGLKAFGAVGGLVCAQLLALSYALKVGKGVGNFIRTNLHLRRPNFKLLKPELPYAGMVLITSLATNLLLSFDILVVKHYFPPRQAGFYTGISIISNIIYYVSGPIASVLLPSLRVTQSHQKNFALLKRSLALVVLLGGIVTAIFLLIPHFVVLLLLGSKFTPYAKYLRGLSVALFAMSLSNLLIYYHIGLRHFLVAPVALMGLIVTIWLLVISHATIGLVVRDLIAGALLLLVLLLVISARYSLKKDVA